MNSLSEDFLRKLVGKESRYSDNEQVAVGSRIRCANCASPFLKEFDGMQFCGNNCKDAYFNDIKTRQEAQ